MAIQIGRKIENNFSNPIGLMSDCHRRIKKFLSIIITVLRQTHGGELNVDQKKALETALTYFREAAPKHTLDEEQSLFPRVRDCDKDLTNNTIQCLDHLQQDHANVIESHQNMDRLGKRWISQGQLCSEDCHKLSATLGELSKIYKRHIYIEEHEIFPVASKLLSSADVEAIGREMALRRNIDFDSIYT
ncbi:MAG TPA: hemerythrin domain-containing protein [Acidobacteriota bacterium]|nr:hemerythrin domain-containing protein [Acidobacteriota bacterium]